MKKIKLELVELKVNSFETETSRPVKGTVQGNTNTYFFECTLGPECVTILQPTCFQGCQK